MCISRSCQWSTDILRTWPSVPVPTHPSGHIPLLTFLSFGNKCWCCLPNWHAPHTPLTSFSLSVGSSMTTPFDCIPLSFWRLIWRILLCHSSISVSALSPFCKHGRFYLVRLDDKHLVFPSITSGKSAFLFNEATTLVESDLHALLHNLANWDQILCDGRYMQAIFGTSLFAIFSNWDIFDMPNRVSGIISSLDITGSIQLP